MGAQNIRCAPKVELLATLFQDGWIADPLARDPHVPGGPMVLAESMLSKSRLYFVCLLELQSMWEAGVPFLAISMPDEYYHCCLDVSGQRMRQIVAREDFARLTNTDFKLLRKGANVGIEFTGSCYSGWESPITFVAP